jgi:transposase-like protein
MFECPKCNSPTQVIETRYEERRRRCKDCGKSFWSEERFAIQFFPPRLNQAKLELQLAASERSLWRFSG